MSFGSGCKGIRNAAASCATPEFNQDAGTERASHMCLLTCCVGARAVSTTLFDAIRHWSPCADSVAT